MNPPTHVDVVIVGAGPTGLWLACELALRGVSTCILERRTEATIHSRALTLHPRTLEVLDMRGLVARFLDGSPQLPTGHYANLDTRLDFSVLDTRHPYTAFISQARTESLIEQRAQELGVPVLRGQEVLSVEQDANGVRLTRRGPDGDHRLTAAYVVGCDGGNSIVRRSQDIDFIGTDETLTGILGDVQLSKPPAQPIARTNEAGTVMVVPVSPGLWRIAGISARFMHLPRHEPLELPELQQAVQDIIGEDLGMHSPFWLARYGDSNRLASQYRKGRALLAGDAAHIHFPAGGVGLNVGVQDAMNLGWKLALVVKGAADESLLDSYHDERHVVGAALCEQSRSQVALFNWQPNGMALRRTFADVLRDPALNLRIAAQLSAMAVDYSDGADASPRVGQRLPDFNLSDGSRLFDHLQQGQFVLLDPANRYPSDGPAAQQLRIVKAAPTQTESHWQEHALLCRPDGHLAWFDATQFDPAALDRHLQQWFSQR